MSTERDTDRFVRQLLADESTAPMPDDVFRRLDAAVRAEAQHRASHVDERSAHEKLSSDAKRSVVGNFDSVPESDLTGKSLDQIRQMLRRH